MTWGGSNRIFSREEEKEMVSFMIDGLANDGVAMPEAEIKRQCNDYWRSQHPYNSRQCSFSASNGWMHRFKIRNELSGRVSGRERKNEAREEDIQRFNEGRTYWIALRWKLRRHHWRCTLNLGTTSQGRQ